MKLFAPLLFFASIATVVTNGAFAGGVLMCYFEGACGCNAQPCQSAATNCDCGCGCPDQETTEEVISSSGAGGGAGGGGAGGGGNGALGAFGLLGAFANSGGGFGSESLLASSVESSLAPAGILNELSLGAGGVSSIGTSSSPRPIVADPIDENEFNGSLETESNLFPTLVTPPSGSGSGSITIGGSFNPTLPTVPSTPVITPSTPVVSPSTPVITPSTPLITPSTPVVPPSAPVVTVIPPGVSDPATSPVPEPTSGLAWLIGTATAIIFSRRRAKSAGGV